MNTIGLIDLTVIPDEELKTHRSIALLELLQKHIAHRDNFVTKLKKWLEDDKLHHYLPLDLFGFMILYGLQSKQLRDPTEFLNFITTTTVDEEYQTTMQTVAQYLKQDGILIGRQEGDKARQLQIAKNLLQKQLDPRLIAETTGLSEQELSELQQPTLH